MLASRPEDGSGMKYTLLAFALFLTLRGTALAQTLAMDQVCAGSEGQDAASLSASEERPSLKLEFIGQKDHILVDQGFCKVYRESKFNEAPGGWKVRLYMSHSFTHYFNSDVTFQSSRYSVQVKDYQWAERGSRSFFNPSQWFVDGHNPAQMIDEPTNTFTVSIEKDGNEFFLSVFHPKFYQDPNQIKQISGTINGTPVNGVQPINAPYHDGGPNPGESQLVVNEFGYAQMLYEVGYGHRFTVLRSKVGNVTYIPHVGVGLMFGKNHSVMVKPGQWWEFDQSSERIQMNGFGTSMGNRIEYNLPNERLGVFYENRIGVYKMESPFFDGTQKFKLGFVGNSIGVKFVLFHSKPKHSISP